MKHSRFLSLTFKIFFTVGAFWLALHEVDFDHLAHILQTQASDGLVIAGLLIMLQIALGGLRWRMVLSALSEAGKSPSVSEGVKLYYISAFFNCCLPGTVGGDVVRVWLAKSGHVPLPTAIYSVVIDRIIALVALGILVFATLPLLGNAMGFDAQLWLPVMFVVAIAGLLFAFRAQAWLAPYQQIRLVRWLLHFIDCLRLVFKHPKTSAVSLGFGLFAHVCFCLCAYVLAASLGAEMTILQSLTLVPLVMLAITMPVSIGGWGVREVSMVGMLGLIGISQEVALTLSIEIGLLNIVASAPGAILWVLRRRRNAVAA